MKFFSQAMSVACCLYISGCSFETKVPPAPPTIIGDYSVKMTKVPGASERVAKGMTHLMFIFSDTDPFKFSKVPDEVWESNARRLDSTVERTKMAYGSSAYVRPDGILAVCAVRDSQKGLCGRKFELPVEERVKMAKSILDADETCDWVGFDQAFNAGTGYLFGASDRTLHITARCT